MTSVNPQLTARYYLAKMRKTLKMDPSSAIYKNIRSLDVYVLSDSFPTKITQNNLNCHKPTN